MTERTVITLPDLTVRAASDQGWLARSQLDAVVPSLAQARACLQRDEVLAICERRVVSFDPPSGAVLVASAGQELRFWLELQPALPEGELAWLAIGLAGTDDSPAQLPATSVSVCRTRIEFRWTVPAEPIGIYELSLSSGPPDSLDRCGNQDGQAPSRDIWIGRSRFAIGSEPFAAPDACAITLHPAIQSVAPIIAGVPAPFPSPPALTVDSNGCVLEAWDADGRGRVLRATGDGCVELLRHSCGPRIARFSDPVHPVIDAIFWDDTCAVLFPTELRLFDLRGCPADPPTISLRMGVALAVSDKGFLVVVCEGAGPNVVMYRRDGCRIVAPDSFDGRGWYARHRNRAFVLREGCCCGYQLEPSEVATGCCVEPARAMTEQESLFFRAIDDLPSLRRRPAFSRRGEIVIAPEIEQQLLDSGRPGTQWDRLLLFGEIPTGCSVRVETRAADDLGALDPLVPDGWSAPIFARPDGAVPVCSPGDLRTAAADVLVLARPGRYLSIRLTLLGDGRATPRIRSADISFPRRGISQYLPRVFQESTSSDDFLRRWLSLFETTGFDGIAKRLDEYPELFTSGSAPEEMLPFLSEWLQIPLLAGFKDDPDRWRRAIAMAAELAKTRGTPAGLALAVKLYLGFTVQVVESFQTGSNFVLGVGATIGKVRGTLLGCQTILTSEMGPTDLGEARLGCTWLLGCEERSGCLPHHFDVLAPTWEICSSEKLAQLQHVVELEKPAHTTCHIRKTGWAGWVVGTTALGQDVNDQDSREDHRCGIAILNGPPRPKPIGEGFRLGFDSRLPGSHGPAQFELGVTGAKVGITTRPGA